MGFLKGDLRIFMKIRSRCLVDIKIYYEMKVNKIVWVLFV